MLSLFTYNWQSYNAQVYCKSCLMRLVRTKVALYVDGHYWRKTTFKTSNQYNHLVLLSFGWNPKHIYETSILDQWNIGPFLHLLEIFNNGSSKYENVVFFITRCCNYIQSIFILMNFEVRTANWGKTSPHLFMTAQRLKVKL